MEESNKIISIYDHRLKSAEELERQDKLRLQKQKDAQKRKQDNDQVCRNYQIGKYKPSRTK